MYGTWEEKVGISKARYLGYLLRREVLPSNGRTTEEGRLSFWSFSFARYSWKHKNIKLVESLGYRGRNATVI